MTGIVTNALSHSNPNYHSIKEACSLLYQGDNGEVKQLAQVHVLNSTGAGLWVWACDSNICRLNHITSSGNIYVSSFLCLLPIWE